MRSHRPFIEHVRIVIGSSKSQERERRRVKRWEKRQPQQREDQNQQSKQSLRRRSQTWACENEDIDQTNNESVMLGLEQVSLEDNHEHLNQTMTRDARSFSMDVMRASNEIPLAHEADSVAGAEEEKQEDTEDEDKKYHLLFVLDSDASARTFVTDLHKRPCKMLAWIEPSQMKTIFSLSSLLCIPPFNFTRYNSR